MRLVPVAVGRAAFAVGAVADSGFVLGLTRSRLWIGLLAGLLVGIVGLNVAALQFNATASKTAAVAEELKRENSALQAQIQQGLSNERLQRVARRLGLIFPEPEAILNLTPRPGDAVAAAKRLRGGQITLGGEYVTPIVPAAPVAVEPLADPAVAAPVETATTEPEPAAVEAAAPPAEQPDMASAPLATAPSGGAMVP